MHLKALEVISSNLFRSFKPYPYILLLHLSLVLPLLCRAIIAPFKGPSAPFFSHFLFCYVLCSRLTYMPHFYGHIYECFARRWFVLTA